MAGRTQLDFFDEMASAEISRPRWLWARCPRCRQVRAILNTDGLETDRIEAWKREGARDGLLIQAAWASSEVGECDCTGPYQRHSPESRQAAESARPKAGTARARVLEFIESRGGTGATDEEIQIGLDMRESTQRPRRVELVEAGWLIKRGTRLTRSGNEAAVWVARR